jgi:hypothetical protein
MIKMGRRRKTKTNEERRESGRRKHITEKGETQVGGCTQKTESVHLQIGIYIKIELNNKRIHANYLKFKPIRGANLLP